MHMLIVYLKWIHVDHAHQQRLVYYSVNNIAHACCKSPIYTLTYICSSVSMLTMHMPSVYSILFTARLALRLAICF